MGHRIIEINNQSVVAVPHEKIVSLLATSVGEVISVIIFAFNKFFIIFFFSDFNENHAYIHV